MNSYELLAVADANVVCLTWPMNIIMNDIKSDLKWSSWLKLLFLLRRKLQIKISSSLNISYVHVTLEKLIGLRVESELKHKLQTFLYILKDAELSTRHHEILCRGNSNWKPRERKIINHGWKVCGKVDERLSCRWNSILFIAANRDT